MFHPPAAFFGQSEHWGDGAVEGRASRRGQGRGVREGADGAGRAQSRGEDSVLQRCGNVLRWNGALCGGVAGAAERCSALCREVGASWGVVSFLGAGRFVVRRAVSFRGTGWGAWLRSGGVPLFVCRAEKRTGERLHKVAPPSEGGCEPCGYSSLSVSA